MSRVRSIAALTATLVAATLSPAAATVVFDNFDAGGTFHPSNNLVAVNVSLFGPPVTTQRLAVRFTVSGNDYHLNSITLPISIQKNVATDLVRVRLAADNGGEPGATIEVLSENQNIWPAFNNPFTTTTTLTSVAQPILGNGATYWIVTEPTALIAGSNVFVDARWYINAAGNTVTIRQQGAVGALPADPWTGASTSQERAAFRVEGTITTPTLSSSWGRIKHMYR